MNELEKLSAVWHWVKANTDVQHDVVHQHLENLEDRLNRGFKVIPTIVLDSHETLMRANPEGYNHDLFDFWKIFTQYSSETVSREMFVCSSIVSAAMIVTEELDGNFNNVASKTSMHSNSFFNRKTIKEALVDDDGIQSPYYDQYVSVFIPTWTKGLIDFPKLE
jgi:hypothetical protein